MAAAQLVKSKLRGKDLAELEREGGWDVLADAWSTQGDIWKSYSSADLEKLYKVTDVIFACVRLIYITAPEAKMTVGRYVKGIWEPYDEHPLYDLWRRPNGSMDYRTFTWNHVAHLELTGQGWIWKLRRRGGQVYAMQPVPTSWVDVSLSKSGNVTGYTITQPGAGTVSPTKYSVPPNDMFYTKYPDPSHPGRAVGPTQAALKSVQIDDARASLMIEVLSNLHFSGMLFKSQDFWNDDQKREIRGILRDMVGPGRRGDALFVSGQNVEVEQKDAPGDIDWPSTASLAETRMCASYQVPPIMVGLRSGLERSTYANLQESKGIFYYTGMKPRWQMLAAAYEKGLLIDEGDEETEIEPDFSMIPEMQGDVDARHARARDDFHGGVITRNRAREIGGEAPLPDTVGDVLLQPMNLIEIAADGSTPIPAIIPDDEPTHDEPDDWEDGEEPEEPEDDADAEEEDADDIGEGKSLALPQPAANGGGE